MFGGGNGGQDPQKECNGAEAVAECEVEAREVTDVKAVDEEGDCIDEAESEGSIEESTEVEGSIEPLRFNRIAWRNGSVLSDSNRLHPMAVGSAWKSLIDAGTQQIKGEGGYDCAFNHLFSEEDHDTGSGLDHLLGLFGNCSSTVTSPVKSPISTPPSSKISPQVRMSVLTQRGKNLAEEIHTEVASNAAQVADLEAVCPQWKENVAYAMLQSDSGDVREALGNIQQRKARLEMMKISFMQAWHAQQRVLGLYEVALNKSLTRLDDASSQPTNSGVLDCVPSQVDSRCAAMPSQECPSTGKIKRSH